MKITEIQSIEALEPWESDWNRLVEDRPMRTTRWLLNWWRHVGDAPSRSLNVWLIHQGDELVGIAPLYRVSAGTKETIRVLGDGSVCTDHTTWFAKPGHEILVGDTVADRLSEASNWSRVKLECVDHDDSAMEAVLESLDARGCTIHKKEAVNCWFVPLPESWDEYLAGISKNHRKRCRRWVRSYFDSGRVKINDTSNTEFDELWSVFQDLHAQRWGNENRPRGCFSDLNFGEFHEVVSRELAAVDQLRLSYISLDDQPIAAEYQLLDHDTLYAYQSGISDRHREVGPGNLSLLASIQYAIQHGLRRLDLMRGDESYKLHWGAVRSSRSDIRVWPRGINGQMEFGFQKARQMASDWLGK